MSVNIVNPRPSPLQKCSSLKNSVVFKTFLIAALTCVIIFLPFVIYDYGYFFLYGDFNVQQVSFYRMVHDAVRSGDFLWSWTTDLGANTIGSYAFYLMGSPFFWLTIPFPSSCVPYLMAPLLMLKISLASTTGCAYIKRFVKNEQLAVVGGLLYGFSGFSVYNMFFNHFHEAMVFFPLLLLSLEELIENDRKGVFALSVFACATVNYFFFVGQVVFVVIYFFVRLGSGAWKFKPRHAITIAFEAIAGLAMSSVILLPAIFTVLGNPRTTSEINGWSAVVYSSSQRYVHILQCLFFPPDIPARPNFTPDSNAKWASVAAWLPMFGMTGVIATLQLKQKHWLKTILWVLLICAFIPGLNAAFYLFNSAYYARWFYMLSMIMAVATVTAFENSDADWERSIRTSLGITAAIALVIGLCPKITEETDGTQVVTYGLMNYRDRLWVYAAIAALSVLLVCIVMYVKKKGDVDRAVKISVAGITAVSVLFSVYFITLGKTLSYDTHNYIIPMAINGAENIELEDGDSGSYRIDTYDCMSNLGMFWNIPCIQAFHSVVPGSIIDFYESFGVERSVSSCPEIQKYGLRELLSVRWLFSEQETDLLDGNSTTSAILEKAGYTYYDTQNGFNIYENEYYVPYGFTFDKYISQTEFESIGSSSRHLAALKALVLTDEQITRFGDELLECADSSDFTYSATDYKNDCEALADECSYNFERTNHSFTSDIVLKAENMVFFSVPYEEGWSATVNGEPVEIENVDNGMMAVRCPAGDNHIEFTYNTPWLNTGICVSLASAAIIAVYCIICAAAKKRSAKAA